MCTAASFKRGGHFFGRTLDNDVSYGDEVVISPRNFKLWRGGGEHYAVMGMATVKEGLPLYYDGMNEKGLCMAGLNFIGFAGYSAPREGRVNLAQYELIPYILGTCATVAEAIRALEEVNLTDEAFSPEMPAAQLHWMISDGQCDIVAECTDGKMHIYADEAGVLTNNPPFDMQMFNLNNYMALSAGRANNNFCPSLGLSEYGFGMGAIGLPGDFSSQSRFVRAAFIRNNYVPRDGEDGRTSLFHILGGVSVPHGCCRSGEGWAHTLYTCCMDGVKGAYSYTTYGDPSPHSLTFGDCNPDGNRLLRKKIIL